MATNIITPRKYSHKQMLYVTGLTALQIQTWYKRGVLADFTPRKKSRGVRRKYGTTDLLYLAAMREISLAGVPLLGAGMAAVTVTPLMFSGWMMAKDSGIDMPRLYLAIWWPSSGSPVHPSHYDDAQAKTATMPAFELLSPEDDDSIEKWMERHALSRVHIINLRQLTAEVFRRIECVDARAKA